MVVGVTLFLAIIYFIGPDNIFRALVKAGFGGIGSFLLLLFLQLLAVSLAWQVLLNQAGYTPSLWWITISQTMGYTGNIITPSMYLGGEPVAAYFLARRKKLPTREVMGTMVSSKVLQLFAFLILLFTGSFVYVFQFAGDLPESYTIPLFVANVIAGGFALLLFVCFFRGTYLLTPIIRFFARMKIFPRLLFRMKPKIRDMENNVHRAFQQDWHGLFIAFLWSLLAMFVIYLRPILFFYFFPSTGISLLGAAAFFSLSQLVQALQFTPGGLGIFDLATIGIFHHLFGIEESTAMSFNLGYRFADAVLIGVGAGLMFHYGALIFFWNPSEMEQTTTENSQN